MKFEIFSRKMLAYTAATASNFPHTAVIEVVTYEGDDDLRFDHFAAYLKLVFSDVDMPSHPGAMQTDQAQQIVNFVNSFEDIDTLITSCEAGMSRSPAIAAAIMIALGGDDQSIWSNTAYSPNAFCYRMVLKAFGQDDSVVEDKATVNLAVWDAALKSTEGSLISPKDIFHGIVGLCVGDALGVPIEFTPRSDLIRYPIDDMVGYGVHGQAPGTWSDDTGLTLALMDSLSSGILDYDDIMKNFSEWLNLGAYTANGEVFDVGHTTMQAISNYDRKNMGPLECGSQALEDNGNGSLMRILPAMYFLVEKHGGIMNKDAVQTIHMLSSLTHAHNISKMACVIYCNVAFQVMTCRQICQRDLENWRDAEYRRPFLHQFVTTGIQEALAYYSAIPEYAQDYVVFERLEDREFRHYLPSEIKSSGYVVDTLEAAIWCLLNNSDYSSTVLAAVNLGNDTDTTAAVAGGLAGLFYQDDAAIGIPKHWINEIINLDLIKVLCNKFSRSLCANQAIYEYWGD